MILKKLSKADKDLITIFFKEVFTKEEVTSFFLKFIKQIEGYMKTESLSRIFLQTDRNMPAYEFYKKNGFEELQNHVSFVKSML